MRKAVFASACLLLMVVGTASAQRSGPPPEPPANPDVRGGHADPNLHADHWLRDRSGRTLSLAKARERLAAAWQQMGLSPERAKEVAAAYAPNPNAPGKSPFAGKSDAEAAELIQQALDKKDYRSANELLVQYQQLRQSKS